MMARLSFLSFASGKKTLKTSDLKNLGNKGNALNVCTLLLKTVSVILMTKMAIQAQLTNFTVKIRIFKSYLTYSCYFCDRK